MTGKRRQCAPHKAPELNPDMMLLSDVCLVRFRTGTSRTSIVEMARRRGKICWYAYAQNADASLTSNRIICSEHLCRVVARRFDRKIEWSVDNWRSRFRNLYEQSVEETRRGRKQKSQARLAR